MVTHLSSFPSNSSSSEESTKRSLSSSSLEKQAFAHFVAFTKHSFLLAPLFKHFMPSFLHFLTHSYFFLAASFLSVIFTETHSLNFFMHSFLSLPSVWIQVFNSDVQLVESSNMTSSSSLTILLNLHFKYPTPQDNLERASAPFALTQASYPDTHLSLSSAKAVAKKIHAMMKIHLIFFMNSTKFLIKLLTELYKLYKFLNI